MAYVNPFVLLVEDDNRLRSVIARNLQAWGYTVLEAATYGQALDRMAIRPSIMIMDINLPDASGWDVASWLETQETPVPIVVMSGYTDPTPKQWKHFNPVAFLPKPFPIDDLLHIVQEYAPL